MSKPNSDSKIREAAGFMKYTSMAFQMIGAILFFVFLGRFLDKHFGMIKHASKEDLGKAKQFPLFTFIGSLFGVASSLYLALKSLKK